MRKKLTEQKKKQIYEEIREILSDELATSLDEIGPKTKIIEDLGGDSLLYFELIEGFKQKYEFDIELRTIGQYLLENPVYTVEEVARAVYDVMEKGEGLVVGIETG